MDVEMPDGTIITDVPEGTTQSQLSARYAKLSAPAATPEPQPAQQPQSGVMTDLQSPQAWRRGAGLATRTAAEGLASLPNMVADLFSQSVNYAPLGLIYNRMTGKQLAPVSASQAFSQGLTEMGLPQAETPAEQLVAAGGRGAMGGMASAPVFGATGGANAVRGLLSGATGGTASEGARQAGWSPTAQLLAGLAGSLVPGAVEGGARAGVELAKGAGRLVRPMTRSGQEKIAANTLASQTDDVTSAIRRLKGAKELVPGSQRTAGSASEDIGLLTVEKGLRSKSPAAFGERMSEQNAARQAALDEIAGTPDDIARLQAARDSETGAMRKMSLDHPFQSDIAPVKGKIDEILASPVGKRQTVSSTLKWAKEAIGNETDPAALYEIRKDLQLAMRGKLQPSTPNAPNASTLASARRELGQVVESLDSAIESTSPGFKAYLERYKELSIPIDQKKVIQEIQRRAETTAADITTGRQFLSPAMFRRSLDKALAPGSRLSSAQVEQLKAIQADLDYANAVNSPLVKAPGSDTFQNLSIAQAIGSGKVASHPFINKLLTPLKWLYKGSDEQMTEILTRAMLDPKLAARMLERATPKSMETFATQLGVRSRAWTAGAVGSQASMQRPEERKQDRKSQGR